jgi:hypothetical protein
MSAVFAQGICGLIYVTAVDQVQRAAQPTANAAVFNEERLPTDSIGSATVTFAGVNANSEIRVYRADGVESAGVELCDANHALTWSVYAPGANSIFRIVVVHPDYKIKEFTYTPTVGAQSLPIQQEADKWYSNPA